MENKVRAVTMKEILIDAIVGHGVGGSYEFAEAMTKAGLARFTGNQHNPEWQWNRDTLTFLSEDQLYDMYRSLP